VYDDVPLHTQMENSKLQHTSGISGAQTHILCYTLTQRNAIFLQFQTTQTQRNAVSSEFSTTQRNAHQFFSKFQERNATQTTHPLTQISQRTHENFSKKTKQIIFKQLFICLPIANDNRLKFALNDSTMNNKF
jgi:hypothetical protein